MYDSARTLPPFSVLGDTASGYLEDTDRTAEGACLQLGNLDRRLNEYCTTARLAMCVPLAVGR